VRTADEREMQKIYGYLGRKGFRYDVVRQVIQNSIENA
jgi:regulatory protein